MGLKAVCLSIPLPLAGVGLGSAYAQPTSALSGGNLSVRVGYVTTELTSATAADVQALGTALDAYYPDHPLSEDLMNQIGSGEIACGHAPDGATGVHDATTIGLDFSLSPLVLASVALHEMEHVTNAQAGNGPGGDDRQDPTTRCFANPDCLSNHYDMLYASFEAIAGALCEVPMPGSEIDQGCEFLCDARNGLQDTIDQAARTGLTPPSPPPPSMPPCCSSCD